MDTSVTEIAADVFRLSTFAPDFGIQFNQFLVRDDDSVLIHTGMKGMFEITKAAVSIVMDPSQLRWITFSHFESDECGALNEWLALAPQAEACCGFIGATVSVNDFAIRPPRALANEEYLVTGRRALRYLATPHLPHGWDAGLIFEETENTLFCSDLFFHPGDPRPLITADIVAVAREAMVTGQQGPLPNDIPYTPYTDATFTRIADLEPRTLAVMHGSSFSGNGKRALLDLAKVVREVHGSR